MAELICVASGKGGVGKSTFTANVAACLSLREKKVLVIDCDVNLKNLDIVLGMEDDHLWDSGDVYAGRCSMKDAITRCERFPNLYLLAAPLKPLEYDDSLCSFLLEAALNFKTGDDYDFVFVDLPSGLNKNVSKFLRKGLRLIVVATPDSTSIHDAEAVAFSARSKGLTDTFMVVNRIRYKAIKKHRAPNIDDMIDTISIQLLGLIPEDQKTSEATNTGILVTEFKRAYSKKAYFNIAARIDGVFTKLYKFWR